MALRAAKTHESGASSVTRASGLRRRAQLAHRRLPPRTPKLSTLQNARETSRRFSGAALIRSAGWAVRTRRATLAYFVSKTRTLAYSEVGFAGSDAFTLSPDCATFSPFLSASM